MPRRASTTATLRSVSSTTLLCSTSSLPPSTSAAWRSSRAVSSTQAARSSSPTPSPTPSSRNHSRSSSLATRTETWRLLSVAQWKSSPHPSTSRCPVASAAFPLSTKSRPASARRRLGRGVPARGRCAVWTRRRRWLSSSKSPTSTTSPSHRASFDTSSLSRATSTPAASRACASPRLRRTGRNQSNSSRFPRASTRRQLLSSWLGTLCASRTRRSPSTCCAGSTATSSALSPSSATTARTTPPRSASPKSSPSTRSLCSTCGGRSSFTCSTRLQTRRPSSGVTFSRRR
mmetsp:Transcript_41917/g.98452  ORF Transcript_41917/g.98452 Transcript_41917/m.98452 type:complete len:289 (+) Transcript_41917:995-1861(+)